MSNSATPPVTVWFLNGPNANLYGLDANKTYGSDSFPVLQARCEQKAASLGVQLRFLQSNHEGQLIDWLHEARENHSGIVINPGGYSHTSVALADALAACDGLPIMEIHISNIHRREPFRHHSYVSAVADGVVAGCGIQGYAFAVERVCALLGAAG